MAIPKEYTLAYQLEKKIIQSLAIQSHSITELCGLHNANYYTVRKIIMGLQDEGAVKIQGFRGSARVYSLAKPGDVIAKESIPSTKDRNGNKIKLTALLAQVGMEDTMLAGKAATALPRTMARIFMAALRYDESDGNYPVGEDLTKIQKELHTNYLQLKYLLKLYEAILHSDAFWDLQKVRNVPHDIDFDRDEVIKAYRHYYPDN
jgi:predicted transcriptional regulator